MVEWTTEFLKTF